MPSLFRQYYFVSLAYLLLIPSAAVAVANSSWAEAYEASSLTASSSSDGESSGLLYFTQERCPPCRQMLPTIEHLIGKGFPIHKIDALEHPQLIEQFRVESTPTFVLIKDGQELKRYSGVLNSYQINSLLIDAGISTDQNVLTKPTLMSPLINFLDRLRPATGARRGQENPAGLAPAGTNRSSPTASIPPSQWSAEERAAMSATARIKIQYRTGQKIVSDYGTATVIHRTGNDLLLITCGHVFRESQGHGEIQVELDFTDGAPRETVRGQLLLYDAEAADVALLAVATSLPIQPMKLAGSNFNLPESGVAFSVGCDHRNPATVRRGEYLSTIRCGAVQIPGQPVSDVMVRKFAIAGRPVSGRSGGGLFTADGRLIGVCNAAVFDSDEGRYSAIDNVYELLGKASLAHLFHQAPNHALVAFTEPEGELMAVRSTSRQRFYPVIDTEFLAQYRSNSRNQSTLGNQEASGSRATQLLGQSPR